MLVGKSVERPIPPLSLRDPNLDSLERLSAQRMLRLAAGQIFLAQSRFEEVSRREDLGYREKDVLCESIGNDLHGWFKIAKSSAEGSTLAPLLAECATHTLHGRYCGQAWFSGRSEGPYFGSWGTFLERCGGTILKESTPTDRSGFIAEFQLETMSDSLRTEIVSLLQKWRIDPTSKDPQVGLEWSVTDEDLQSYLSRDKAILFLCVVDGKVRGVNITYSDIELSENPRKSIPSPGGSEAGTQWCAKRGLDRSEVLYDWLVATDRAGAYRELHEATSQTAYLLRKRFCLGGVRVASDQFPANAAMMIHERRGGWRKENYFFTSAATGARAQLVSRPVGDPESFRIHSEHRFPVSADSPHALLGDPRRVQELSECGETTAEEALACARGFLRTHGLGSDFREIYADRLSGGELCISLWRGCLQFSFFQPKGGLDQWYTNESNNVRTFKECLRDSLTPHMPA